MTFNDAVDAIESVLRADIRHSIRGGSEQARIVARGGEVGRAQSLNREGLQIMWTARHVGLGVLRGHPVSTDSSKDVAWPKVPSRPLSFHAKLSIQHGHTSTDRPAGGDCFGKTLKELRAAGRVMEFKRK